MSKEFSGRQEYIKAKALFVASRSLRASKHPPWSDIEEMENLLQNHYKGYNAIFQSTEAFKLAIAMGFDPNSIENPTLKDAQDWLAGHPSDGNVLSLQKSPGPPS